ncbi:hypothetical protein P170DRAFT_512959 [Aspergillus steynii IBT 23096]|uniref:Uncharacterized protein n=1 Tax=Aspergillus steynii IBT 23096 TaxID=1392250 RepID=A0A2I2FW32_9EURO|nr:uncharacterized protein P170DRAFT_512959 [Aspergillus steynii IBT 23096]PLB44817.1 hypothetical protein P170DRAFT_512959 [Aspergillus steynii IBT 23096]
MFLPIQNLSWIASVLDENQIPHVLGWDASSVVLGVPYGPDETQFIIEDDYLSAAMDLASNAGFVRCTDGACRVNHQETHSTQIPDGHFHTETFGGTVIFMYKKSLTCWGLPDLPVQAPDANDRNFMLSNDPRLPTNWVPEFPPIKILTWVGLIETLILLQCRDVDHLNDMETSWSSHFYSLHIRRGPSPVNETDLQPHFRPFWRLYMSELRPETWPGVALQDARRRLRLRLLADGNMPPPPDTIAFPDPANMEIRRRFPYLTLDPELARDRKYRLLTLDPELRRSDT